MKAETRGAKLKLFLFFEGNKFSFRELSELTGFTESTLRKRFATGDDLYYLYKTAKVNNNNKLLSDKKDLFYDELELYQQQDLYNRRSAFQKMYVK